MAVWRVPSRYGQMLASMRIASANYLATYLTPVYHNLSVHRTSFCDAGHTLPQTNRRLSDISNKVGTGKSL